MPICQMASTRRPNVPEGQYQPPIPPQGHETRDLEETLDNSLPGKDRELDRK